MAIFNPESVRNAPINSVVDAGTYLVRIAKASAGVSKQKQTPSVDLEYEIIAGPEQIDGRVIAGKHVFQHIYFPVGKSNEVSNATIKRLCKATGVEIDSDEQVLSDLVDRELKIKIAHREYQGEPQEDVKGYEAV